MSQTQAVTIYPFLPINPFLPIRHLYKSDQNKYENIIKISKSPINNSKPC